ncbi:hypothetical protein PF004_g6908 [Phytophthora fragariae]|uniref:Uncharacterized protein n=1 Tax=Phytophthora fragariae TaxID=53985 RepID=A0A6G0PBD7_9STRA|nr:hypothetical protein PF004_g6908 [Phytophthora fragariae]
MPPQLTPPMAEPASNCVGAGAHERDWKLQAPQEELRLRRPVVMRFGGAGGVPGHIAFLPDRMHLSMPLQPPISAFIRPTSMPLKHFIELVQDLGQRERRERQRGQHYLTRDDLHPEPRYGTAWEAIYGGGNDRAFITTTGFDVRCFHYLLSYFEPRWNAAPIPRNDVDTDGESRPDRRSLSPTAALALVLHYLAQPCQNTRHSKYLQ